MFSRTFIKLSLSLLLVVSSWAQADERFSQMFVFGDSLSDTGNLASVVGGFPEPPFYLASRVSNGPVAVEVLAERLGLQANASLHLLGLNAGSNFSVAGANAVGIEPIDLDTQLIAFLASQAFVAPADALYVVFLGGNDIRNARDNPDFGDAKESVKLAAAKVGATIEALSAAGARQFLLVNAPNVGAIPESRLRALANSDPGLVKRAQRLSKIYRRDLRRIANRLGDDDDGNEIEIVEFDLYRFLQRLLRKADKLGFSNSTDACFSTTFGFHPDCQFGANFDRFVFFDEIHPTGRVHALAGEALFEALDIDEDDDDDDEEHDD